MPNRVLIVDDDPRICRLIKRVANGLGVESVATDDSALFESVYLEYEPNIILMDLQMPKIDGVELLRKLADLDSRAAIILVSAQDKHVLETTADLGKSLGLSMAGVLVKPLDFDKLKTMLEKKFEPVIKHKTRTLEVTTDDLINAIEQNELVVYYQPQVLFSSGKIIGVEALVRWQHPEHGLLFPDSFIPLAEKSKEAISSLTYMVLETALQDDMERRENGIEVNLSINLSAKLLSDLHLPDRVEKLLNIYHFSPNRLLLEITESGAMENPTLTMDILTRLRLKNIGLSLDDFGTGFSSLVQLYRMPFTEMKVDKSFVIAAMEDAEAAAIARITIDLGHSMGLKVVAEGIEDQETYDWLKELGCDIGQGYFISRPIDVIQLSDWMNEYDKRTIGL